MTSLEPQGVDQFQTNFEQLQSESSLQPITAAVESASAEIEKPYVTFATPVKQSSSISAPMKVEDDEEEESMFHNIESFLIENKVAVGIVALALTYYMYKNKK